MGSGSWSSSTFSTFAKSVSSKSRSKIFSSSIDAELDPNYIDFRESRDSEDHPNSTPIICGFDVTGSMGHIPEAFVKEYLGDLMDVIVNSESVSDPQILFGAIGDSYSDRYPLQISQFESDNRINDWLTKLYLEGGGGGTLHESYELFWYWFSLQEKVKIDSFEKRGEKGLFFTIGDEKPYDKISRNSIQEFTNINMPQVDISFESVTKEVSKRFHSFHIMITEGFNYSKDTKKTWQKYIGERAIEVNDYKNICDVIKSICLMVGGSTLDESMEHVKDKKAVINSLTPLLETNALAVIPKGTGNIVKSIGSNVKRL